MVEHLDCIFCKIADRTIPSPLLWEDEDIVAFADITPRAPVHILIIPRKHIPSLQELTPDDLPLLAKIGLAAQQLAEQQGIAESGYRLLTNCRADGGQEVDHLHFHLLGGHMLGFYTHPLTAN